MLIPWFDDIPSCMYRVKCNMAIQEVNIKRNWMKGVWNLSEQPLQVFCKSK